MHRMKCGTRARLARLNKQVHILLEHVQHQTAQLVIWSGVARKRVAVLDDTAARVVEAAPENPSRHLRRGPAHHRPGRWLSWTKNSLLACGWWSCARWTGWRYSLAHPHCRRLAPSSAATTPSASALALGVHPPGLETLGGVWMPERIILCLN
eukprot:scaffold20364_cov112-Isochrysis_galbana.AAC.9